MNKGLVSGFPHFRNRLTRPSEDRIIREDGRLILPQKALKKISRSPVELSVSEEALVVKR
jgi:hypothetical protein